jgi:hypothetical protein
MVNASSSERESCAKGSSTRRPHSQVMALKRPRRSKFEDVAAPRGGSKMMKNSAAGDNTMARSLCGSPLSTTYFDCSEWEIMYPRFVEEGLVDPSKHTHD